MIADELSHWDAVIDQLGKSRTEELLALPCCCLVEHDKNFSDAFTEFVLAFFSGELDWGPDGVLKAAALNLIEKRRIPTVCRHSSSDASA